VENKTKAIRFKERVVRMTEERKILAWMGKFETSVILERQCTWTKV